MNKVIYYRDQELITHEDKERLLKVWGTNRDYNFFNEHEWNTEYNTGLLPVINILATIMNNESLNNKDIVLRERISKAKRLTKASGRGYDYVEQNLLIDLVKDTLTIFNKENPETDTRLNPTIVGTLANEFFRIYDLPYTSIMKKVEVDEDKIGDIAEPKKRYDKKVIIPVYKKLEPEYSQNSAYKEYCIKLPKLSYKVQGSKAFSKSLMDKYPFLGKLYYSTIYAEHYWQINVYDYVDRDWALQTIIDEMISKE